MRAKLALGKYVAVVSKKIGNTPCTSTG